MNLLIAEDNSSMRLLLRSMVADVAESVWECVDGEEACASYAEHRPDWVLMDVNMPNVDGLEATRRIVERFPGANVMIVTEYDDDALRERALELGARDYVLKDDLSDLCRILSESAHSPRH